MDAALAFQPTLKPLLPFVPVLRGGNQEDVVWQAIESLRADNDLNELETLLAYFASFVMEKDSVLKMRVDMSLLYQSPWYEQAFREGMEKGMEEGHQEGHQEGRQEMQQFLLQHIIQKRFGMVPSYVTEQVSHLSIEQLDSFIDLVLTVTSLDEFVARLPAIEVVTT